MNQITIKDWKTPASAYPLSCHGDAKIVEYRHRGFFDAFGVKGVHVYRANTVIRGLEIRGKTWMVDDPPHWWAMEEHATFYQGHVLCAGLGLGLIIHTLDRNDQVSRITVLEREQDVIDLVGPHLPECEIIHGDFWDYDGPADGVLFDLYVGDARQLIGQALRDFILIQEKYPDATIRIHGFPNRMFDQIRRSHDLSSCHQSYARGLPGKKCSDSSGR